MIRSLGLFVEKDCRIVKATHSAKTMVLYVHVQGLLSYNIFISKIETLLHLCVFAITCTCCPWNDTPASLAKSSKFSVLFLNEGREPRQHCADIDFSYQLTQHLPNALQTVCIGGGRKHVGDTSDSASC